MFSLKLPNFNKTEAYLTNLAQAKFVKALNVIGVRGAQKLADRTPELTGETAASWSYEVESTKEGSIITWHNSVMAGRTPLAILIRYGHATGTGGYVRARNFVTPAMQEVQSEIMDLIAMEIIR